MNITEEEFKELFIVKKFLGEGSFGSVFVAKNKDNGRKYAVKRILLPHDEEHKKLVWRERDIMDKVAHPNIIHCSYFVIEKEGLNGKKIT